MNWYPPPIEKNWVNIDLEIKSHRDWKMLGRREGVIFLRSFFFLLQNEKLVFLNAPHTKSSKSAKTKYGIVFCTASIYSHFDQRPIFVKTNCLIKKWTIEKTNSLFLVDDFRFKEERGHKKNLKIISILSLKNRMSVKWKRIRFMAHF